MLGTASLNRPAGQSSGGARNPLCAGDAPGGGSMPARRNIAAEEKHAARLASTGAGARAAALATLRASRREVAAGRLPARRGTAAHGAARPAHGDVHDEDSQTARVTTCVGASQTSDQTAGACRAHGAHCVVQPAVHLRARAAHQPAALSAMPLEGGRAMDTGAAMPSYQAAAPWQQQTPGRGASGAAPPPAVELPSPPRRGRHVSSPLGQLPDLALRMGLPPSPRLPGRHKTLVSLRGRGPQGAGSVPRCLHALRLDSRATFLSCILAPVSARHNVVIHSLMLLQPARMLQISTPVRGKSAGPAGRAAASVSVSVVPQQGQPPRWLPPQADGAQHVSADAGAAVDVSLDATERSIGAPLGSAAAPANLVTACSDLSADARRDDRWDLPEPGPAPAEAVPMPPVPGRCSRPNLVSDIEALRHRWRATREHDPARHAPPPGQHIFIADTGPFLCDGAHLGQSHHGGDSWSAPADRLHSGDVAACGRFGVLPEPSSRRDRGEAVRFLTLRSSYPGVTADGLHSTPAGIQ